MPKPHFTRRKAQYRHFIVPERSEPALRAGSSPKSCISAAPFPAGSTAAGTYAARGRRQCRSQVAARRRLGHEKRLFARTAWRSLCRAGIRTLRQGAPGRLAAQLAELAARIASTKPALTNTNRHRHLSRATGRRERHSTWPPVPPNLPKHSELIWKRAANSSSRPEHRPAASAIPPTRLAQAERAVENIATQLLHADKRLAEKAIKPPGGNKPNA